MVNDCSFPRHSDFKRQFEVGGGGGGRIVAAISLTGADTMLIKVLQTKGTHVRISVSLILVTKRTAGGG